MRAVVAAFAANLGIAVIKFVAFLLTGSASMLAESVHSVADTGHHVLLFVLLEDLAALFGLTFAFAGVALSVLTGNGRWDGVGSLAIGLLLATAAAILAVEMKSLLIGESASPEVQQMIVAALEGGPEL